MGYIMVKPRDPQEARGFRGYLFPYPWADRVITTYEEMGGAQRAKIEIVRSRDAKKVDVQVYEPEGSQDGHEAPPSKLSN